MNYPPDYRSEETRLALRAVRAGECAAALGLSGAGKSNFAVFLAGRPPSPEDPRFVLVDCNRALSPGPEGLFPLLGEALGGQAAALREVEALAAERLAQAPRGLCLILDRFEALDEPRVSGPLRALRDRFKYSLTYLITSRRALDPRRELAELFAGCTLRLGSLARADARWSAGQYAARRGLAWDEADFERILALSRGYPSLLRAVCEAHAAGVALEEAALRDSAPLRRRVEEFWAAHPSPEEVRDSGLEGCGLLAAPPERAGEAALTAAEARLLEALRARPGVVLEKDTLIQAVWPEEAVAGGLRDDSLAQLVHRLREKIEPDPAHPRLVRTVPGRGYRYGG